MRPAARNGAVALAMAGLATVGVLTTRAPDASPPAAVLRITPGNQLLPTSEAESFKATLSLPDGGAQDVTASVKWGAWVPGDGGAEVIGRADGWPVGEFMARAPGVAFVTADLGGVHGQASVEVVDGPVQLAFEVGGKRVPPEGGFTSETDLEVGSSPSTFRVLALFEDGRATDFTEHVALDFGGYKGFQQPFDLRGLGTQTVVIAPRAAGHGHLIAHWRRQPAMLMVDVTARPAAAPHAGGPL